MKKYSSKSEKNCLAVYPNPTSDVLKLDLKENIGKTAIICIISQSGQLMTHKEISKIEDLIEFDVRHYSAGTYFANVLISEQKPISHCFVIQ